MRTWRSKLYQHRCTTLWFCLVSRIICEFLKKLLRSHGKLKTRSDANSGLTVGEVIKNLFLRVQLPGAVMHIYKFTFWYRIHVQNILVNPHNDVNFSSLFFLASLNFYWKFCKLFHFSPSSCQPSRKSANDKLTREKNLYINERIVNNEETSSVNGNQNDFIFCRENCKTKTIELTIRAKLHLGSRISNSRDV